MLNELKQQSNMTNTLNGAAAYRSSESECLDFFALCGACRNAEEERLCNMFMRAYAESPDTAMKILFYARDIRKGIGERNFFRVILTHAAWYCPVSVKKNIKYIEEYGRLDDLLELLDTPCEKALGDYLKEKLEKDISDMANGKPVSLLAKWLPSVNTSSEKTRKKAAMVRKLLGMSEKKYRKTLASLRTYIDVLEKRLCEKDYTFDYEKQPSKALFNYRQAFVRNDEERYKEFLCRVNKGEAVLNTSSLTPYDIVQKCINIHSDFYGNYEKPEFQTEVEILDTTWKSLPVYGSGQNAIAVVDGSGSMYLSLSGKSKAMPISVAVSLGIYFAEHSMGEYANHFITFSASPRLIELKGENIYEKTKYCMSYNEVSNTNIEKVFNLILETAVNNKIPKSEMPDVIYIISDMEFDAVSSGDDKTVFENAKENYNSCGYDLPLVVFWNVDSLTEQMPVSKNDTGAVLVSGMSPTIFDMVMSNDLDPMKYMHMVLNSGRYDNIKA